MEERGPLKPIYSLEDRMRKRPWSLESQRTALTHRLHQLFRNSNSNVVLHSESSNYDVLKQLVVNENVEVQILVISVPIYSRIERVQRVQTQQLTLAPLKGSTATKCFAWLIEAPDAISDAPETQAHQKGRTGVETVFDSDEEPSSVRKNQKSSAPLQARENEWLSERAMDKLRLNTGFDASVLRRHSQQPLYALKQQSNIIAVHGNHPVLQFLTTGTHWFFVLRLDGYVFVVDSQAGTNRFKVWSKLPKILRLLFGQDLRRATYLCVEPQGEEDNWSCGHRSLAYAALYLTIQHGINIVTGSQIVTSNIIDRLQSAMFLADKEMNVQALLSFTNAVFDGTATEASLPFFPKETCRVADRGMFRKVEEASRSLTSMLERGPTNRKHFDFAERSGRLFSITSQEVAEPNSLPTREVLADQDTPNGKKLVVEQSDNMPNATVVKEAANCSPGLQVATADTEDVPDWDMQSYEVEPAEFNNVMVEDTPNVKNVMQGVVSTVRETSHQSVVVSADTAEIVHGVTSTVCGKHLQSEVGTMNAALNNADSDCARTTLPLLDSSKVVWNIPGISKDSSVTGVIQLGAAADITQPKPFLQSAHSISLLSTPPDEASIADHILRQLAKHEIPVKQSLKHRYFYVVMTNRAEVRGKTKREVGLAVWKRSKEDFSRYKTAKVQGMVESETPAVEDGTSQMSAVLCNDPMPMTETEELQKTNLRNCAELIPDEEMQKSECSDLENMHTGFDYDAGPEAVLLTSTLPVQQPALTCAGSDAGCTRHQLPLLSMPALSMPALLMPAKITHEVTGYERFGAKDSVIGPHYDDFHEPLANGGACDLEANLGTAALVVVEKIVFPQFSVPRRQNKVAAETDVDGLRKVPFMQRQIRQPTPVPEKAGIDQHVQITKKSSECKRLCAEQNDDSQFSSKLLMRLPIGTADPPAADPRGADLPAGELPAELESPAADAHARHFDLEERDEGRDRNDDFPEPLNMDDEGMQIDVGPINERKGRRPPDEIISSILQTVRIQKNRMQATTVYSARHLRGILTATSKRQVAIKIWEKFGTSFAENFSCLHPLTLMKNHN